MTTTTKPRMSRNQKHEAMERRTLAEAGYDLAYAMGFFKKRGIRVSRHPRDGWQFTSVLAGNGQGNCAVWCSRAGSVENFMAWLDAPSTVIKARDEAQARIAARQE